MLYDLKEDVANSKGPQPFFDAGMLEGALIILSANVDEDDPRMVAERDRQLNQRLLRALDGDVAQTGEPQPFKGSYILDSLG